MTRRALWLAGLLMAFAARAEVFDTFGFSPRATAMSGAMTAEAKDYSAVFYNPALLIRPADSTFGLGLNFFRPITEVTQTDSSKVLDCTYCTPPDTIGSSLGIAGPLGGKLHNRVALGLGVHLPFQRLLHVDLPDPNRPFWYQYQAQSERIELFAGVGVKVFDWLQLGVGVQVLANLVGPGAETQVDLFSKQVKVRQVDSELQTRLAPNAGLVVQPISRLRFGFVYRGEIMVNLRIPATVDLQGVGTLAFTIEGIAHYSPHTFNLGVAWDVTDELTLTLDGSYEMWSRAPSPYMKISIDLSGDVLKALGLDQALDLQSDEQAPGFQDTISGKLAAEYRLNKRFSARAGAFYRPTHVPRQNVPGTNILDGTTLGGSLGLGFNFDDPLEIFAAPITIDLAGLGAVVLPRETRKEATDTVPSYTYSAKVVGVSAAVRYDF
ncbi:MAG: outer membrane protein transport protein [Archangiaceae bacterium]|nr:outer membrane protein transport protein [Archangiaceae bacterium]